MKKIPKLRNLNSCFLNLAHEENAERPLADDLFVIRDEPLNTEV
jgi:hypothetical protein